MSDLDQFELFTYVAQYGGLTSAAKILGMSKAALSKQIKLLETKLKVDLFSRKGYRLQLTEQGNILLEQCLRLKKELEDTRAVCQQFTTEPEGILKVAVFEYFAKTLIFPKLADFLSSYPKLEVHLYNTERLPDFEKEQKEQIDLAVGFSLPAGDDIVRRNMLTTRYVICASPEYFKKQGEPKDLNNLQQHTCIGHSGRNPSGIFKLKSSNATVLKPSLILNSVSNMIECAKQGMGIIQLPLYMLKNALKKGELKEILAQYSADDIPVYYYYPKYRHTQPKVRKFIDFFITNEEAGKT